MYKEYYVDVNAKVDGNGSKNKPFSSINLALTHDSKQIDNCKVIISPGIYIENINISKPTILIGSKGNNYTSIIYGSIQNNTRASLKIMDLRISNSQDPGAILITNKNANTFIHNVVIDNSNRFGIFQNGGVVSISETFIQRIKDGIIKEEEKEISLYDEITFGTIKKYEKETTIYDELTFGTAIALFGVRGNLKNVSLDDNFQGLIIGGHSKIEINTLRASGHKTNPKIINSLCNTNLLHRGSATIEICDGANIKMENIKIYSGEYVGIYIHDHAFVLANNLEILFTKHINCHSNGPWDDGCKAGHNISLNNFSHLELTNFDTGYATIGIGIFNSYCKLSHGIIHNNLIGAVIKEQQNSFNDLEDKIIWKDNVRNVDTDTLPVPDPYQTPF